MARPLHDGSSPEPVGNIQVETTCVFPPDGASSCAPGDQSRPLSRQSSPDTCPQAVLCRRVHETCESSPSSSTCAHRLCPQPLALTAMATAGATYVYHPSDLDVAGRLALERNVATAEPPMVQQEHIEREIALRLRRIGDQMNELYFQRRVVGERHWWRPLRWHLTQFVSEILAALYNPLLDILPHN